MSATPNPPDAANPGALPASVAGARAAGPAQASTTERPAPEPLLDDAHTRIDWYRAGTGSRTVVVTFDPLLYLWPKTPFGLDFLQRQGVHVVAVQRKAEDFHQNLSRETFMQAVQPALQRHDRVVLYGSSLGAYASLYYGRDLDCRVIAPSPRVSVHPVYGNPGWQQQVRFQHERFGVESTARCQATIFYDPHDTIDRRYIEEEVLPQFSAAEVIRLPWSGHPSTQFLGDIGYMAPYVRSVVAGTAAPALRRRERSRSATYFQVMADHCLAKGRTALAEAFVHRSLELRPQNMLALRTHGRALSQQGRWSEALHQLEAALALAPADPLTGSLLVEARRRQALAAAPSPPGSGETAPLSSEGSEAPPGSLEDASSRTNPAVSGRPWSRLMRALWGR